MTMPLFSMHVSSVSRSTGANIVRYAAYRAGERLIDHASGRVRDYASKSDVVSRDMLAPEGAPDWTRDREQLWNKAERAERRRDSRLAQEVYVAIPREIPLERRREAVLDFAKETFVARGMVADIAIHAPTGSDGREDPHAHILLTTRALDGGEFGRKQPEWSHPRRCREFRAAWELHANTAFAQSGMLLSTDRRSLQEQRREVEKKLERAVELGQRHIALRLADRAASLDRLPQPSHTRATSHMEKKGIRTGRGDRIREVRMRNRMTLDERRRRRRLGVERAFRAQRIERIKRRLIERTRLRGLERERDRPPWRRQREEGRSHSMEERDAQSLGNRRERDGELDRALERQQPEPWPNQPPVFAAKGRSRLERYLDRARREREERMRERATLEPELPGGRVRQRRRDLERGREADDSLARRPEDSAERIQAIIDGRWRPSREVERERERGDEGLGLG